MWLQYKFFVFFSMNWECDKSQFPSGTLVIQVMTAFYWIKSFLQKLRKRSWSLKAVSFELKQWWLGFF